MTTVPPPSAGGAGLRPARAGPAAPARGGGSVSRPGALLPRGLDRLPDAQDRAAELLRSVWRDLRLVRQLQAAVHERRPAHLAREQRPLGGVRADHGDGGRARLRGARRACALVGRVPDRDLHADGDLGVRGRRHLAAGVREGPRPRSRQRSGQVRARRLRDSGCADVRRPVLGRAHRHAGERVRGEADGATRRNRLARPDGDPDRRPSLRCRAGGHPEPLQGGITGVVWRDFKPGGGGKQGAVDTGEVGLSGVTMELRESDGRVVDSARSEPNGLFTFSDVSPGTYRRPSARRPSQPRSAGSRGSGRS